MKLFIANASKQHHSFIWRLPGMPGVRNQTIPIGGQIQVSGVETKVEIDCILDQHRQYGLLSVQEIEREHTSFHGLCYSVDAPVSIPKLQLAMERNIQALTAQGKKNREEAAIFVNNEIENGLQESGTEAGLKNLEMSVVEEEKRGGDEAPRIAEGVRITRAPGTSNAPNGGARRGRRAA